MDLSIRVQDTKINIRVAGLVKTAKGYLFEKSDNDYIFVIGGRVKLGESTREAITREIKEEIGMNPEKLNLCSIVENFYINNNEKVQELCFVYEINDIFTGIIPPEFIEVGVADISKYDVRPAPIVEILKNDKESFKHIIAR